MKTLLTKLVATANRRRAETEATDEQPEHRVLFVCMGNICRSPTAEGVFRSLAARELPELRLEIDSAGTHAYHIGEPPDPRAQRAAQRRAIDLSAIRARRIVADDFAHFDLILAMDPLNEIVLREQSPPEFQDRIRLFLEFAPQVGRNDVPDPYYGGSNGFEYVLDLAEEASAGLIAHLKQTLARS